MLRKRKATFKSGTLKEAKHSTAHRQTAQTLCTVVLLFENQSF